MRHYGWIVNALAAIVQRNVQVSRFNTVRVSLVSEPGQRKRESGLAQKSQIAGNKKGAYAPFSQLVIKLLLVVDVHRNFETEADVAVFRSLPIHYVSPVGLMVRVIVLALYFAGSVPKS